MCTSPWGLGGRRGASWVIKAGNDQLFGFDGIDLIDGLAGNDTIDAGSGSNTITGGQGNDSINSSSGSIDTYLFSLGDGADSIDTYEANGTPNDILKLGAGISAKDIKIQRIDFNLVFKIGAGSDQVTVNNWFWENSYQLASLNFADGSSLTNAQIALLPVQTTGTTGNDNLFGFDGIDLIDGLAGADTLTGLAGSDRFAFRFSQSSITAPDRVTDFAFNSDKISLLSSTGSPMPIPTAFSRAVDNPAATLLQLATRVFADANGALAGNQPLAANAAALVRATNAAIAGTYLLINDSAAALNASNDLLINLTGHSGTLPAIGTSAANRVFT